MPGRNLSIFSFKMKKFLKNILMYFGSITLGVVLFVSTAFPKIKLYTKPFDGYLARCTSLTNECARPRLVLVGGSNLACGVDNQLLGRLLDGKYEVVNLGFHAGLGIGVHFDLIFDALRPDDVVVLAAEYTNFGDRWSGGLPAVVLRCDVLGRNLFLSTANDRWSSADCGLWRQYAKEKMRKVVGGVQLFEAPASQRSMAGSNKTVENCAPAPGYVKQAVYSTGMFKLSAKSLGYLKLLGAEFKSRGVTFLISAPAYDSRHYALHSEIDDIYGKIREVPGLHIISRPADYVFPLEEMADTAWHVNCVGRKKRTIALAEDIKHALKDGLDHPVQ